MKTHIEKERTEAVSEVRTPNPGPESNELRRESELLGLPAFVLKLAASRRIVLAESGGIPRFRHD